MQTHSPQRIVVIFSSIAVLFVLVLKRVSEVWYGARKMGRIYAASLLMRLALLVAQLLRARRAEVEGIAVSLSSLVLKKPLLCMSLYPRCLAVKKLTGRG